MINKVDAVADSLEDYVFYRDASRMLVKMAFIQIILIAVMTSVGMFFYLSRPPADLYATRADGGLYRIRSTENAELARQRSIEASEALLAPSRARQVGAGR